MMRFLTASFLFIMSTSMATGSALKKIEILEGWVKPDGSLLYGLKISLAEGWKTYWHTPGPMGLKPHFDFEGSYNINSLDVLWPSPIIFGSTGFESIGYENGVILPIVVKAKKNSDPVNLKIRGQIGICYNVCIPAEFETQSALKLLSNDLNTDLLAALANLPLSPSDLKKKDARCNITFSPTGFRIEADVPFLERADAIIIFSIIDYGNTITIEQPKQVYPGKIISATGEWHDEPNFEITSDLITITHLDKSQVIEQRGC